MTFALGRKILPLPSENVSIAPPKMPSLPRRAANFGKAVMRSTRSVMAGNRLCVSDRTKELRQAKCVPCKWNNEGRCSHPKCGCPVSSGRLLILKTELFSEFCPDDPRQWDIGEIPETK